MIFRETKLKVDSLFIKIYRAILENFALIHYDSAHCVPSTCLVGYELMENSN